MISIRSISLYLFSLLVKKDFEKTVAAISSGRRQNSIANDRSVVYVGIIIRMVKGEKMVNKAILIGRLGKDPEVRYTPDGMMITNFNLATDEQWKDKNGQRVQKTEWHRIVTFGKLADICGQYLSKGKLVFVEGRIQTRAWEDKEGNKRYTTEIVAANMQMLDSKGQGRGQEPSGDDRLPSDTGTGVIPEDDVPF
jgi:single-strand DNA-binding protein